MKKPLITLTLAFIAGVLLAHLAPYLPLTTALAVTALAIAAGAGFLLKHFAARSVLLSAAGVAVGGVLAMAALSALPAGDLVPPDAPAGPPRNISGTIVSPLERVPGRVSFLLRLHAVDGRQAAGIVRVLLPTDEPAVGQGDRIQVAGKLVPPRGLRNPGGFDYASYLRRQGVQALIIVRRGTAPRVDARGTGVLRTIQDWREEIRRNLLRDLAGEGSAVLQSVVLGEEGGLSDDLRDRFQAAGVTHILSISGSHLGLVALLCFWAVRQALLLLPERWYHLFTVRIDPRKAAALLTVVPVTFYALLAGGEVATLRSLVMILAGLLALLLDREHDLPTALALSAIVLLAWHPAALLDLSFQLSYLSVLAILFVVDAARLLPPPGERWQARLRRSAGLLFCVSCATAVATAPLVAFHFNRLSPIGIFSNMLVVPYAGLVVVPLGLLSGIASLGADSLPLAWLNQASADAFVSLVSWFAEAPAAAVFVPAPGLLTGAGFAALALSLALRARAWLGARYRPLEYPARPPRAALVGIILSAALLAAAALLPLIRTAEDRITFLDVGQGDSALVETADGGRIVIDGGGTPGNRFDVGRRVVAPLLLNRGIRTIDLVVLSHPHPDHMNGITSLLRMCTVRELWISGLDTGLEGYRELGSAARARGTSLRAVSAGDRAVIGSAILQVLHPPAGYSGMSRKAFAAENDRSLAIHLQVSGRSFLFPGDIHADAERTLLRQMPAGPVDIVKVPHHGSRTSSSAVFVSSLQPAAAVISVGAGNPYRHPAPEVIDRYRKQGTRVYRTDRDGAVLARIRRGALSLLSWSDVMLRPVSFRGDPSWWDQEQVNWKRLWIRRAAT